MAAYGLPLDFIAAYTNGWKMGKEMCEATGFILSAAGLIKCFYRILKLSNTLLYYPIILSKLTALISLLNNVLKRK